jgi:hypothetical protein
MSLTRRTFLTTAACAFATTAKAAEPFPVNMTEGKNLDYKFQRRDMEFATNEPAGTIVVDAVHRFLYHVQGGGQATRYGVAVGKATHAWTGEVIIKKMKEWPTWIPAPYHIATKPSLAQYLPNGMPGGPDNPLGARAMYLFKGEVDTDQPHSRFSETERHRQAGDSRLHRHVECGYHSSVWQCVGGDAGGDAGVGKDLISPSGSFSRREATDCEASPNA